MQYWSKVEQTAKTIGIWSRPANKPSSVATTRRRRHEALALSEQAAVLSADFSLLPERGEST